MSDNCFQPFTFGMNFFYVVTKCYGAKRHFFLKNSTFNYQ